MIEINEYDYPITVAGKIITNMKIDDVNLEIIKEIADHLMLFYNSCKKIRINAQQAEAKRMVAFENLTDDEKDQLYEAMKKSKEHIEKRVPRPKENEV